MNYSQMLVYSLEIIGTIAFAFSGALLGIQRKMDIFGVNVLGLTTAIGGGIVRDLILGINPPNTFCHPSYTIYALITSTFMFIVVYMHRELIDDAHLEKYNRYINVMDAIGLGAFTVIGINTAIQASFGENYFLLIFVGAVTGVGGGLMRDVMAGVTPYIFTRHVYACASLLGAIVCVVARNFMWNSLALILGAAVTILMRFLAAHYRWNLPKIQ